MGLEALYSDLSRRLVTWSGGGLVRESDPKWPKHSALSVRASSYIDLSFRLDINKVYIYHIYEGA